jgi:hypothetical protein
MDRAQRAQRKALREIKKSSFSAPLQKTFFFLEIRQEAREAQIRGQKAGRRIGEFFAIPPTASLSARLMLFFLQRAILAQKPDFVHSLGEGFFRCASC